MIAVSEEKCMGIKSCKGYIVCVFVVYFYLNFSAAAIAAGIWKTETVDSGDRVGEYSSIAIDTSGNPHISYYDDSNGNLKYTTNSGSGWDTTIVDTVGDVGRFTSIELDSGSNPHP